ncbi:MFS transporter [Aquincola tertiaricarbonis]|uniref:MFS transporter n=1 Tax=Aquincola tertiaricarbonis TaxID=391953 RepID=UPI0006971065|nr:MFS transporter [Aquincola tertiaricarbonis]
MSMSSNNVLRMLLPLAVLTATGMLAMDLYLPAVPALQRGLGLSVAQGQTTVAVFLAGLAASQLVWGELLQRLGPRLCIGLGILGLVIGSFGCAAAQQLELLLLMRALQGVSAGAATVIVPTVLRTSLADADAVRGIAAVGAIESTVPAAAPVVGAFLLQWMDWRWTFAVVGILALLSLPFALRVTPVQLPEGSKGGGGYLKLLRNARFMRISFAHALSFGALMTFVASAPQLLHRHAWGSAAFPALQAAGVASFALVATQAGQLNSRIGAPRMVQAGACGQAILCVLLTSAALGLDALPMPLLMGAWMAFCALLGLRGAAAFSEALKVPTRQVGRASALMVLMLLLVSAGATQAVAPFLSSFGMAAVAVAMALQTVVSAALVMRWPERREQASSAADNLEVVPVDPAAQMQALIAVWRASVLATHHFLRPGDVDAIEAELRQALPQCQPMMAIATRAGQITAFMHVADAHLEMLFVHPAFQGQGHGSALLRHAECHNDLRSLEVNEQNGAAVRFYERHGFRPVARTEVDGQGRPYPILRMARSCD